MAVGDRRMAAFAFERTPSQPRHFRARSAFVNKDKLLRIEIELAFEPHLAGKFYIVPVLFVGMRCLFL